MNFLQKKEDKLEEMLQEVQGEWKPFPGMRIGCESNSQKSKKWEKDENSLNDECLFIL